MIFLIGMAEDSWGDADFEPMFEVGYFTSEAEALAWIDSTDYLQGLYDEYVTETQRMNDERRERHERKVTKYNLLVEKGYGDWETDPGEFYPWKVESFEKYIEDYQFKVIPVSAA